jgi:Reverse transcriptase (RNA-dependent DNA polymerase)
VTELEIGWIDSMLKNRLVKTDEKDENYYNPVKGCPQGGCLSPLLWCLVIDSLIKRLTEKGFFVSAFADDVAILMAGNKNKKGVVCGQINELAIPTLEKWCRETGLSVNPAKSNTMLFKKSKQEKLTKDIKLFGKIIPQAHQVKYLGVLLDCNLRWNLHVKQAVDKANKTLWAIRSMVSRNWGVNPKRMMWVYQQIILPRLTYGSVVFWHKLDGTDIRNKLNSIQGKCLRMVTGAMKTTPIMALEAMLDVFPLDIRIKMTAIKTAARLIRNGIWRSKHYVTPHKEIVNWLPDEIDNFDTCPRTLIEENFNTVIGERNC